MISYSYREFPGISKRRVLYANTNQHEFFYLIKDNSVQIYVDQYFLGTLDVKGLLRGKNKRRLIARINDLDRPMMPIIVGDKETAILSDPLNKEKFNPRAFEFIISEMSHADFLITLALSIYTLVDKTKAIKKL